jgi:hypothetical protein
MRRLQELQLRRDELQARSCAQRAAIGRAGQALAGRLSWADRLSGAAHAVASRPVLTGAVALAAMLLVSRGRLFGWLARAAVFFGTARRVLTLIQGIK